MNEQQIKTILRAIGISSSVIIFVLIVGAVFLFYKNYLETKKLKLQIAFLQKVIKDPGSTAKPEPLDNNYRVKN